MNIRIQILATVILAATSALAAPKPSKHLHGIKECLPAHMREPLVLVEVVDTSLTIITIQIVQFLQETTTILDGTTYRRYTDGTQYWSSEVSTNQIIVLQDLTNSFFSILQQEAIAFTNGALIYAERFSFTSNDVLRQYRFDAIITCPKASDSASVSEKKYLKLKHKLGFE